jgi:hypothetical protein
VTPVNQVLGAISMVFQITKKTSSNNRLSEQKALVEFSIEHLSAMIDSCSEIKNDYHRSYLITRLQTEIKNIEKFSLEYFYKD